ncbi:hypothetical protein [Litoribacillus peritrichatus]|uniref:hypothetical protein n=1 Tax=Litoribacillus peritrichatus TaxID=718191 RepID=UPI0031D4BE64
MRLLILFVFYLLILSDLVVNKNVINQAYLIAIAAIVSIFCVIWYKEFYIPKLYACFISIVCVLFFIGYKLGLHGLDGSVSLSRFIISFTLMPIFSVVLGSSLRLNSIIICILLVVSLLGFFLQFFDPLNIRSVEIFTIPIFPSQAGSGFLPFYRAQGVFSEAGIFALFCLGIYWLMRKNGYKFYFIPLFGVVSSLSLGGVLLFITKYLVRPFVLVLLCVFTFYIVLYTDYVNYGASTLLRFYDIIYVFNELPYYLFIGGNVSPVYFDFVVDVNGQSMVLQGRGISNGLLKLWLAYGVFFTPVIVFLFAKLVQRAFEFKLLHSLIIVVLIFSLQPLTFSWIWFFMFYVACLPYGKLRLFYR